MLWLVGGAELVPGLLFFRLQGWFRYFDLLVWLSVYTVSPKYFSFYIYVA